jgi:hypothetical protein
MRDAVGSAWLVVGNTAHRKDILVIGQLQVLANDIL